MSINSIHVYNADGVLVLSPEATQLVAEAYAEGYADAENNIAARNLDTIANLRAELTKAQEKLDTLQRPPVYVTLPPSAEIKIRETLTNNKSPYRPLQD